jgi:hypothetical protein
MLQFIRKQARWISAAIALIFIFSTLAMVLPMLGL